MSFARVANQQHAPRKYASGKRRFSVCWSWSYPWEANRDVTEMHNRFSTMTEARRVGWQLGEGAVLGKNVPARCRNTGVFHLSIISFQNVVGEATGQPVGVLQRIDQAGERLPLDERVLADTDILTVFSLDHLITEQEASPEKIQALRDFLTHEGICLVLGPHYDVGVSDELKVRALQYAHHGAPLAPRQQRFSKYARSLMKGLGVPVENHYGLRPATVPGTNKLLRLTINKDLDKRGWLNGVQTFNFHMHLPHYAVTTDDPKTIHLLARHKARWLGYFLSICMLIAPRLARAQNRGVYPLGMSALNSGITPESGFSYTNQLLFYARDQAKDDEGKTLPVTGLNTVVMDMNTLTWVSTKRIFGARYSASATLPFAKNNLTSDIQGQISGGGFADSYYLPLILGWSAERADVRAMYGFLAPTGRFVSDANNNVGSGYWTHTLSSGQTFYLTQDKRLILSTFQMYEFHTTQEGTRVHPGQTFDLDYSLMRSVRRTASLALQIGVAGYEARQTTAKVGPNITPEASSERYAVNAVGFALIAAFPKRKASLGFRYFKEFAGRSTFQGYSVQVSGAISF